MTNRRARRHPARPAPRPLTPPAIDRLTGWSLERLADEAGIDRIQALRLLTAAMRRGEVVRLQVGDRVLWSRLGNGSIAEVTR